MHRFARRPGEGRLLCWIASWMVASAFAAPQPDAPSLSLAESGHTDRVIVQWKSATGAESPSLRAAALARAARDAGIVLTPVRETANGAMVLALPRKHSPAEIARLADSLLARGDVAQVAPDRLFFPQANPPDPLFASQWHLGTASGINMPVAWDVSTGGTGIVIAVLDTGKLAHNDLSGRLVGGYDFVSVPARQNDGTACSTTPNDPNCRDADPTDPGDWVTLAESTTVGGPLFGCPVTDSRWHGTAMAGIIAANSNMQGIAGINWSSKILPVRVVGKCGGYESDIADGIRWAAGINVAGAPANANVASVINVSLAAAGSCSTTLQGALDDAAAANVTVVVSAGNQGANASGYSPGNCNNVIAVGAVDRNGGKPAYSNFGSALSISAPGGIDAADNAATNILTTHNTGLTTASSNFDTTKAVFGTSPAAAQVSGVASLLLSAYGFFTPTLVREVLQNTRRAFPTGTTSVMPNPSQADCTIATCGAGIVDAGAALQAAAKWTLAPAAIAGGDFATITLNTTGRLSNWGRGDYAAAGMPDTYTAPFPASQLSGLQRISQMTSHSLALRADGSVWAWGDNASGQLGDGTATLRSSPVRVAGALLNTPVREIAAGRAHSLALAVDGTVWSWGTNNTGQLGDGTFAGRLLPAPVPGLAGVIAIAAGHGLSAAVKSDGTVWQWGRSTATPTLVAGLPANAIAVALGQQHALYLMADGAVWAQGANNSGLLGNGVTVSNSGAPPVQITALSGITRIAAHLFHSLALAADGRLWAWGVNSSGQLGDGTTLDQNAPVQVLNMTGAVAIGIGPSTSYAIKPDGSVWAWGANINASLGNGSASGANVLSPTQVIGYGGFGTLDLGAADRTQFAPHADALPASLHTSNSIRITGIANGASISVNTGEFSVNCNGTFASGASTLNNNQSLCVRLAAPAGCGQTTSMTATIAGGITKNFSVSTQACDTTPDNFDFFPQGMVAASQVATSNTATLTGINTPAPISITGGTYSIGCGMSFTGASGTVNNNQTVCVRVTASATANALASAALTVGTQTRKFFVATAESIATVPHMAAGNQGQSFALKTNGTVHAWGARAALGQGGLGSSATPLPVMLLSTLSGVRQVRSFWSHALAVRVDGGVWAWGGNAFGELGDGSRVDREAPVPVAGALSGAAVTAVSAGRNYSLAVRSDGTVWAWGNNQYGQLGDGTLEPRVLPVQVAGMTNAVAVAAGVTRSIALKADGSVWEWGNLSGTQALTPVQVPGLPAISRVASGYAHSLYLATDGRVFSRGLNSDGQLGYGNQTDNAGPPLEVPGAAGATDIAAGSVHSLSLMSDGTLRAWGGNALSQLGDGTTLMRAAPVAIGGLSGVRALAAGQFHSLAIKLDGTVWAWGDNSSGQLGTNTATGVGAMLATPTQVLNGATGLDLGPLGPSVFSPQTDVAPSSVRTSNAIVLTGIANGSAISVVGGQYSIGCNGTFTPSAGTATIATLTVAGTNYPFSVTTAACDATPDAFGFVPRIDAPASSTQTSNTVTLTGIAGMIPISISGGLYSIGCTGTFGSAPATIVNNQTVCVRATAAATPDTRVSAALTVGTFTASFDVITPASFTFSTAPKVAAGQLHSAGLRSDGRLFAWGQGGMLGATGLPTSQVPVAVATLSGVTRIAQSEQLAAALRSDGSVWTWGANGSGQLGDGTTTARAYPGVVRGVLDGAVVTAVAAGNQFVLALKNDGTVWAWGDNTDGRLGDGTTVPRPLPVQVSGLANVTAIAAGGATGVALRNDGVVFAWGGFNNSALPLQVPGLPAIASVAVGSAHVLLAAMDRTVWAAGVNFAGQLGDGTYVSRTTPVQVPGLANVVKVAAGNGHSLALRNDGTVAAWGLNDAGQLGDGTNIGKPSPVTPLGLTGITDIGAGFRHSLAIAADGATFAWGDNASGQLGTGIPSINAGIQPQFLFQTVPTLVQATTGGPGTQLVLQLYDTYPDAFAFLPAFGAAPNALVTSAPVKIQGFAAPTIPLTVSGGTVSINGGPFVTSGSVASGQTVVLRVQASGAANTTASATLSAGTNPSRSARFFVRTRGDIGGRPSPQVALGANHSVLLNTSGSVFGAGYNGNGQLGNGVPFSTPTLQAVSGLADATAIASGANHVLALRRDGSVAAWGYGGAGQLGHGVETHRELTPVVPAGLANVTAVAAGEFHSLALKADGSVWAWGLNTDGQCGTGSTAVARHLTPQQVPGISAAIAIAAGGKHSLALLADGSVVAWGNNASGQLGNGTTTSSAAPVAVSGLAAGVISLAAGGAHSLAIRADGTLAAWGDNTFGQLGDGTTLNRNAPVTVTALGNRVARIAAGANHTLALKSGGALYAWGANANSQLGDGATANRSAPFLVASRPNMVAIGAGAKHSGGINARGELFLWGDNYFGQVANKSGNFNPDSAALNVLRGDSQISTGAPPTGSSTGTSSTSGSAVIEIALVSTGYEFPAQTVGASATVGGKFRNQALTQDITGIGISVSGGGFSLQSNTCGSNLTAGSECDFAIQFLPGAAGDAYGELQVASSLEGSPERRSLFGTGVAMASPAIKVSATAGDAYLAFPPQDVGTTSSSANVTITNTGAAPLVINAVALASGGADFTLGGNCLTTVAPGANCQLPVAFSPTLAASLNDELTITSNAGTAKVTLSGTGASDGTAPAISLLSVVSRKTHGLAGPLDIPIDRTKNITQAYTVEPRNVGTGHRLVFTFNSTLSSVGAISVLDKNGQALTGIGVSQTISGNTLTLNLSNVPDAQRMTIQLTNLNGSGSASIAVGFLVGDVTGSRMVTAADIAAVKAHSSQMANSANARFDINLSGDVSSGDITAVKARAGAMIP